MIVTGRAHLHVAAATHAGASGKTNEDRYAVSAHRLSRTDPTPSVFAVVADGIGGHRAGEVAAELAVETISHYISASDASQPAEILHQAVTRASQVILERAAADPERSGMGATCVCAWVIGELLFAAWVGDSRLYLLRNGQIHRLTTDHTWVQEALEHGALTPEQARNHPNAHVIRRYLGSKSAVRPDLKLSLEGLAGQPSELASPDAPHPPGLRLLPGDRLLLCSDGLTDLVDDPEILQALQSQPRQPALESLISLANERGGHDNITIIALEVPAHGAAGQKLTGQQAHSRSARRGLLFSCLALSTLLAIFALLVALLAWYLWLRPVLRVAAHPTPTPLAPLSFPSLADAAAPATSPPQRPRPPTPGPVRDCPGQGHLLGRHLHPLAHQHPRPLAYPAPLLTTPGQRYCAINPITDSYLFDFLPPVHALFTSQCYTGSNERPACRPSIFSSAAVAPAWPPRWSTPGLAGHHAAGRFPELLPPGTGRLGQPVLRRHRQIHAQFLAQLLLRLLRPGRLCQCG
jgi:protein phosphatase